MSKSKTSNKDQGILVILSAPSGCGKTTLVNRLLNRHGDWVRSISSTTRPPREGEKDGSDYFFVSASAFKEMKSRNEFLESAKVFDHQYGTPKKFVTEQLKNDKCVLLAIDVQGAKQIKENWNEDARLVSVFILPPSLKILRDRLEGRKTETVEEIERRIAVAQEEIKVAGSYDFSLVNQNLDETVAQIEAFIEKSRKPTAVSES